MVQANTEPPPSSIRSKEEKIFIVFHLTEDSGIRVHYQAKNRLMSNSLDPLDDYHPEPPIKGVHSANSKLQGMFKGSSPTGKVPV